MRSFSFGVALATAAAAAPLSAQTWQTIGGPSNANSGAYWNNASNDNVGSAVCNVGAILTNTPALTAGSCSSQGPVYLPLNPAPLTTGNLFLGKSDGSGANPGAFRFAAGLYAVNLIGRVAGNQSTNWGLIQDDGTVFTAAQLSGGAVRLTGPFAVWIEQALPNSGAGTIFTSAQSTGAVAIGARTASVNQQFTVFTTGTGIGALGSVTTDAFGAIINSTGVGARYFVGMEDNINCGRGFNQTCGNNVDGELSDRDYNDVLISIQAVPEPATVGLMGFGLLALAGVAKRRKA